MPTSARLLRGEELGQQPGLRRPQRHRAAPTAATAASVHRPADRGASIAERRRRRADYHPLLMLAGSRTGPLA